jgi:hypothetical protein
MDKLQVLYLYFGNTKLCLNKFKALKSKFSSGNRKPNPKLLCATAAAKEKNSEAREPRGGG